MPGPCDYNTVDFGNSNTIVVKQITGTASQFMFKRSTMEKSNNLNQISRY